MDETLLKPKLVIPPLRPTMVPDQSSLQGILIQLGNINLYLISVNLLDG